MPGLGGRRNPVPRSPNTGLRSSAFRGYADYMQTTEFQQAIDELIELATMAPTAVMCAEAVPWRCHRWLIGDALLVRGWRVMDIISADRATERQLSATARPQGTRLTYPPADQLPGLAAGA
jgi:uncharacterized protein (DUF488 family)